MPAKQRGRIYEEIGHAAERRRDGKWIIYVYVGAGGFTVEGFASKLSARRALRSLARHSTQADLHDLAQEQPSAVCARTAARRPSAAPPSRPHVSKLDAGRNGFLAPPTQGVVHIYI